MRLFLNSLPPLVLMALAVFAAWFVIVRPMMNQQEAATARVEAAFANALAGAAKENIGHTERHHTTTREIIRISEENSNEILSAPGAEQAIDPALHAAGLRALCVYDPGSPDCLRVLQPDGEPVAADADTLPGAAEQGDLGRLGGSVAERAGSWRN